MEYERGTLGDAINIISESLSPAPISSDCEYKWVPGFKMEDVEKSVIIDSLEFHNGNRTKAAKALGLSIRTIRNKIAKYREDGEPHQCLANPKGSL